MGLRSYIRDKLTDWLLYEPPREGPPICDYERIRYELRPCDVLLIEGRTRVARVIRRITQSPWTHSCLYIGKLHDIDDPKLREIVQQYYKGPPEEQLFIEGMMGQGTIVSPLNLYKEEHIRICRPRGLARQDAQEVLRHAINKLGTEYDVIQIFDLLRLMLPLSVMPRAFRSSLFSHHPSSYARTICSTVIAEAFTHVHFPILPVIKQEEQSVEMIQRNPRLYVPRDFDYSPYFEIIKYPFIQVVEHGIYRQLPWNQDGLISNDVHGIRDTSELPVQKTESIPEVNDAPPKPVGKTRAIISSLMSPPQPRHMENPYHEHESETIALPKKDPSDTPSS